MRKRYQNGSLEKLNGSWIARWYEDGRRRARTLGRVSRLTKAQAQAELAKIVAPINARRSTPSRSCSVGDFLMEVYLPFYQRKWKRSTAMTNEDRIKHHLLPELGPRTLGSLDRDALQGLLDNKAAAGLSFSVVDHLRWDLKQVLNGGSRRFSPAESCSVVVHAKGLSTAGNQDHDHRGGPTAFLSVGSSRARDRAAGGRSRHASRGNLRAEMGSAGVGVCGYPATGLPRRYRLAEVTRSDGLRYPTGCGSRSTSGGPYRSIPGRQPGCFLQRS